MTYAHSTSNDSGRRPVRDVRNARAIAQLASARSASATDRRRAEHRVTLEYLDVAEAIARRFRARPQEMTDIRQVAYVGLIKAVQRFDPVHGDDIVAFAVPTITGEIKRYLRDVSWFVRPPRQLQELSSTVHARIPTLTQELQHEPSPAELADDLGRATTEVSDALRSSASRFAGSLDAVPGTDGGALAPVTSTPAHDPQEAYERAELRWMIGRACRTLAPRDRRIIYLRFVLERTQSEIAVDCGVSQMQISRLLKQILQVLRERLSADRRAA